MRLTLGILSATAIAVAGCGSTCIEGRTEACACEPTAAPVGVRTCGPSGEFGGCLCPDGPDGNDGGPTGDGDRCDDLQRRCFECDIGGEAGQSCIEAAESGDEDRCIRVAEGLDCMSPGDCEQELADRCETLSCGFEPEAEATVAAYCEGLAALGNCDEAVASIDDLCDPSCENLARRCGNACIRVDLCDPGSVPRESVSCRVWNHELENQCWVGGSREPPDMLPGEGTCTYALDCVARCLGSYQSSSYPRCLESCEETTSPDAIDAANALATCVLPRCGDGCNGPADLFTPTMECHGCVLGEIRDQLAEEGAGECDGELVTCGF